ncbi:hypothetical protein Btru_070097 [Bulinus truncatus]|nr:hypothetical protein Btru_070097 [Bulinus truncatus]
MSYQYHSLLNKEIVATTQQLMDEIRDESVSSNIVQIKESVTAKMETIDDTTDETVLPNKAQLDDMSQELASSITLKVNETGIANQEKMVDNCDESDSSNSCACDMRLYEVFCDPVTKLLSEMLMLLAVFFFVVAAGFAANSATFHQNYHLSSEDFKFLQSLPRVRAGTRLPGFKYVYLEPGSHLTNTLNTAHHQLEIAGSPRTTQHALDIAADIVLKMTKYMPPSMFLTLTKGTVGIFTAAEKLTIYPEMASLASGSCGTSCAGSCSSTCTFDGRKYENLGGLTNSRSVVLDDIVLCTANDPHHHTTNILVHEFGHLVHNYATTPAIKTQIVNAYNAAKQHSTWQLNTYAMANEHEYWAMATATFFGVTHEGVSNTGGMNMCSTNVFCGGVQAARDHLRTRDPALFSALSQVYTNNNPSLNPGISVCPSGTVLVG